MIPRYQLPEIAALFTDELVAHVSSIVVGDPMNEATDVSALISTSERDRVKAWIDDAVADGGRVACGGELTADGVLTPTVIVDARPDMNVCALEVFGPLVAVQVYRDYDDALAKANDTSYGLQAAVFTSDVTKAMKALRTLDFGGVLVNEVPSWRADQMPYGGIRDSGNTKEGPAYSVREMTEERAARQRDLLAPYIADADCVITTAAVPGRAAPLLVTRAMVEGMRSGSVVVDLASETGGNVEGSVAGEEISIGGARVWGAKDVASQLPVHASQLYSMNVHAVVALMTSDGRIAADVNDEIIDGSAVVLNGEVRSKSALDALA